MNLKIVAYMFLYFVTSFCSTITLAKSEKNKMECEKFVTSLPQEYQRGYVEVPVDYSVPSGKKMNIFYFTKIKNGQKPIVFINGGPSSANRDFGTFAEIENRFNFAMVYIDQRGTGCSGESPTVTDAKSANLIGLYSARNIVRDHEQVRKKLFGKQSKWTVVGQSYGAIVADRYISMYPNSVEAVHNIGGRIFGYERERFAEMLKSQAIVQQRFYEIFPGSKEKVVKLNEILTDDKCFQVNEVAENKVCGKSILSLMQRDLIFETSWGRFNSFLNEALDCKTAPCLFNVDMSLNQDFFKNWAKINKFIIDAWWGSDIGVLTTIGLLRQDLLFSPSDKPNTNGVCDQAEKLFRINNPKLVEHLLLNSCDILKQVALRPSIQKKLTWIFKDAKIHQPHNEGQMRQSFETNKDLKYFAYFGDLDSEWSNPSAELRNFPKDRYTVTRFAKRGHFGFSDELVFWQNLTGIKNKLLFGESIVVLNDGGSTPLQSVRKIGNTKAVSLLTPNEALRDVVYVGLANEPLSAEMIAKVKGHFALVDRGGGYFKDKATNVMNAGAVGFMIANNVSFPGDAYSASLGEIFVSIPGLLISYQDGVGLKDAITAGKKVTVQFKYDQ